MNQAVSEHATAIALELVGRETDINELAKLATYHRTHLKGAQFFQLLEQIVKNGRHFARSNRTQGYLSDIHDVCQQRLKGYRQAEGQKAQELAEILGWAVRLMRYYQSAGVPAAEPRVNRAPQPPVAPEALSKVEKATKRETVTLVESAKRGRALVETQDGHQVRCASLPAYPAPRKGMTCRADVARENDVPQQAIFKGWT